MIHKSALIACGKSTASAFMMMLIVFSTVMAIPGSPAANAQETDPKVWSMALVTVQFDDLRHNGNLFDPEKATSSFKSFYDINSYGRLKWNVTISPSWNTLEKSSKDYNITCRLDGDNPNASTHEFIIDALRAASKDLDLAGFDYAMIVYPKYSSVDEQGCTLPSRSWKVDGVEYDFTLSIVRESASYSWLNDNLWVMEHQAGHFLGLPDLYTYDDGKTPPAWDIMGWPPGKHNSTMLGAWSKMKLGWIDEKNIKTIGYGEHETVTLDALGKTPSRTAVVKVPVTSDHYYLLETRLKIGADAYLPADISPGVVITEVKENLDVGKVTWVGSQNRVANHFAEEIKDIAFLEGDEFSNYLVGSIKIKSKTSDSYVVEIDRSTVYPQFLGGIYDHNGIQMVIPDGWKSKVVGWDIFLAKDIPYQGIARFRDSVMSIRIIDPGDGLEDYHTNPLFDKVECKPLSLTYLEVNQAKARETTIRCYPLDSSSDFRPHLAKTYVFSFEELVQGKPVERVLSLTYASDSPLFYATYLHAFEELVASLRLEAGTDIRELDNSATRIREQIQKVTLTNSTIDFPLLTNSRISNFKFDHDASRITFKAFVGDLNGITRIEYDSLLKAPYWIRVDGENASSFLKIEDRIAGKEFVQLFHHVGTNEIMITGIGTVLPVRPVQQDDSAVMEEEKPVETIPENERPVEVTFVRPLPENLSLHPPMSWSMSLAAMVLD
jgi:M6 family metalloprotease-like protein